MVNLVTLVRRMSHIDIVITDTSVESYPILELLGVSIDGQMNFKEHVREVTKKASRQVGVLLRLRDIMPQSAKLNGDQKNYYITTFNILSYCLAFLCTQIGACTRKRVYRCKTATYDTLLKIAKPPTLCNRQLQTECGYRSEIQQGTEASFQF